MKIPVKWLSDYIELDRSLQDIASLLTLSGLEVESISSIGSLDEHILTARIVDLRAHPNAERLTLCSVETVPGDARQVVCGARNMKAGDVVVLATSGARLPDGTQIEQVKLRGQESHGMLCSERELGLGEGNEGIMILEPGTPLGIPFSRVSGRSDQVMELSITPNRSDCLSIQGVGRELAALTGTTFKKATLAPVSGGPLECPPRLTMEAPELCSMYHGRVLADVQVGPSPAWLVARLTAAGLRSINNVVDATNYILMDRGQPLHAFDLDRIEGRHIVVRQARSGERLMCLDGVERTLGGLHQRVVLPEIAGLDDHQRVAHGCGDEIAEDLRLALAREGGVQHCVYSSVASAHRNTGIPHFENKWRVEGTLRAAGFPSYVIIRPVFFMENLITPWFLQGDALMTAMKPDTVLQMITVDDVGRYGALAFERPAQLNRAELDIAGDAATMTQAAAVLSSALGRRITFAQIPAEEVRKNSADFAAMLEWFERVGYNADIEGNALRYGIQNTTLTAWARKTLRPGPPAAGLHAQR